ncbi:MAG: GlxA family transcriptional regulator [Pseudomonadota bacterium]
MQKSHSHITVLLFDRFSNHCLANAIEPLRAANDLSGRKLYSWEFSSLSGQVVNSSSGLPVYTTKLREARVGDTLFVLPSYGFEETSNPETRRALQAARGRYKTLVGMDMGAWALAVAGVLDGRRATLHWDELDRFAEQFPEVEVEPARFILEDDLATCAGAATTLELILEMIGRAHGAMLRLDVASLLMHGERGDFKSRAFRPTGDQLVDGAVAVMRRNLEEPLTIAEVAQAVGQSQRQLEELFEQRLSKSPKGVYKSLRLNEAARLAKSSRFSIAEIAIRCGYADPSAMTRAFREQFGISPSDMRKGVG